MLSNQDNELNLNELTRHYVWQAQSASVAYHHDKEGARLKDNFIYAMRSSINVIFENLTPELSDAFHIYDKSKFMFENCRLNAKERTENHLAQQKFILGLTVEQRELIRYLKPILSRNVFHNNDDYIQLIQNFLKEGLPLLIAEMLKASDGNHFLLQNIQHLFLRLAYQFANEELEEHDLGQNNARVPRLSLIEPSTAASLPQEEFIQMVEEMSQHRENQPMRTASSPLPTEDEQTQILQQISDYALADAIDKSSAAPFTTKYHLIQIQKTPTSNDKPTHDLLKNSLLRKLVSIVASKETPLQFSQVPNNEPSDQKAKDAVAEITSEGELIRPKK